MEIGEAYTKLGFSHEPSPRVIVPTNFKYSLSQGIAPPSQKQWEDEIMRFLRFVYAERVRVNPADRKVVVLENPYWTLPFKQALASALFALKVPAVRFLSGISLPIYITGNESGLIVDVGYAETRVMPMVEGFPIMSAMKSAPIGMRNVHTRFLGECKGVQNLTRTEVEDLVLRFCFVAAGPGQGDFKQAKVGSRVLEIPYTARATAANVLFGDGEEGYNVARLLANCLRASAIDSRAALVRNVVVCGGTSMLPGFRRRLLDEADKVLEGDPLLRGLKSKLHLFESVMPPNIQQFVGASLVVSLDDDSSILRANVAANERLPISDWTTQSCTAPKGTPQDVDEEDDAVF